jgi:hypothetical protein
MSSLITPPVDPLSVFFPPSLPPSLQETVTYPPSAPPSLKPWSTNRNLSPIAVAWHSSRCFPNSSCLLPSGQHTSRALLSIRGCPVTGSIFT